ncbi:hypothetical protein R1flu_022202 [Riccia fluitans]|uniref:Ribosomal protein L4 n=1 Tax=Riccia fluitans TaxID=41844 RepID=A0ABD1ZRK0_9MARC
MAVRAQQMIALQGLSHCLEIDLSADRIGSFWASDELLKLKNDENIPIFTPWALPKKAACASPRQPLQDITHLFVLNVRKWNNATRIAGLTDRVRLRSVETPVPSKKKRISGQMYPGKRQFSGSAVKSARPSTGLRSFRWTQTNSVCPPLGIVAQMQYPNKGDRLNLKGTRMHCEGQLKRKRRVKQLWKT